MSEETTTPPPTMTLDQVAAAAQMKPRTITAWVEEGRFPAPVINGYRCKRWNRDAVMKFLKTGKVR